MEEVEEINAQNQIICECFICRFKRKRSVFFSLLIGWSINDTKNFGLLGLILVLWFSFEDRFLCYIEELFVHRLFNDYEHKALSFMILGGLFAYYLLVKLPQLLLKNYFTPYKYLLFPLVFVFFYFYYRLQGYWAVRFEYFGVSIFDILVVGIGVYILFALIFNHISNKGSQFKMDNNTIVFYHDRPIEVEVEDRLGFGVTVKEFYKQIQNTLIDYNYSFSIGIVGRWGDGKSSFMSLLIKEFEECPEGYIVLKFNPRHAKSKDLIQFEFFQMLYEELQQYDMRFSNSFSRYLKAINVVDKSGVFSFLQLGHEAVFDKENEKEKINQALLRINKRVVVVIDDLDRLLDDEIIEVCKLLDGNASFKHMLFITAYDKDYVKSILGQYSHGTGDFIDKFFTVEKSLPFVHKATFIEFFREEIRRNFTEQDVPDSIIFRLNDPAMAVLYNLRDYKRFLNHFVNAYRLKREGVDFMDFFILSLIEYRWRFCYEAIRDFLIVKPYDGFLGNANENKDKYTLYIDDKELEKLKFAPHRADENNTTEVSYKTILKLFELLFKDRKRSSSSINNRYTFDNYFKPYVNKYANPFVIEKMFGNSIDSNKKLIDEIFEMKQSGYFVNYLSEKKEELLKDSDALYNYIDILLYTCGKSTNFNILDRFKELVKTIKIETLIKFNFILTEEAYKKIIEGKLKGKFLYYSFLVVGDMLLELARGERNIPEYKNPYIFTKEELLAINRWILKDLIQEEPIFNQKHLEVLYNCIDYIEENINRTIHLDKEACAMVREHIEKNPQAYLETFVRLEAASGSSEWNGITGEPFWAQIFAGDLDSTQREKVAAVFRAFIFSDKFEGLDKIITVRNFWALYENNNYQAIQFEGEGNVQEKIDKGLVEEKKQLDQILALKEDFDNLEINMSEALDLFKNEGPNYVSGSTFVERCLNNGIEIDFLYKELCVLRELINEVRAEEKVNLHIDLLRVLRNFDMLKLKLYEGPGGLDEAIKILEERRDRMLKLNLLKSLENSEDLRSYWEDVINEDDFKMTQIHVSRDTDSIMINKHKSDFTFIALDVEVLGEEKDHLGDEGYLIQKDITVSGNGRFILDEDGKVTIDSLDMKRMV